MPFLFISEMPEATLYLISPGRRCDTICSFDDPEEAG
jgi:hypothetical protein